MGADADLVAERLARGARCFVVRMDSAVGGYGWLSVHPEWIGETQLEITPGPGEGYIWNCVTVAEHRRKGIFRSLLIGINESARRKGLKRVWVGSVAIPAERAVASSGFKPALHFTIVTIGSVWHLMRVSASSDPDLASAARAVLNTKTGLVLRRSQPRRH
jgi:GNAT superfamily N-acetyltransferase